MKKLLAIPAAMVLLASCSTTKKTTGSSTSTTNNISSIKDADRDGSSFERAIVIDKKNETEGVAAEYSWMRKNHPEYTVGGQSLQHQGKLVFDVLHATAKDGSKRDFYFDITGFFGKF